MQLQKDYATSDPYAKNRDSVWLGIRKKRPSIPWSKLWMPAIGLLLVILFFALREPRDEDLPSAGVDSKPTSRSGSR